MSSLAGAASSRDSFGVDPRVDIDSVSAKVSRINKGQFLLTSKTCERQICTVEVKSDKNNFAIGLTSVEMANLKLSAGDQVKVIANHRKIFATVFRTRGKAEPKQGTIILSSEAAKKLGIEKGDEVRINTIHKKFHHFSS